MKMTLSAMIATCVLTVGAAAAPAAPKGSHEACAAGTPKAVCCKASVADHCGYVSCCEVGNAAFFSGKNCATCEMHRDAHQASHKPAAKVAKSGCAAKGATLYTGCAEIGNAAFFKGGHACGSCAAPKAAACCGK